MVSLWKSGRNNIGLLPTLDIDLNDSSIIEVLEHLLLNYKSDSLIVKDRSHDFITFNLSMRTFGGWHMS